MTDLSIQTHPQSRGIRTGRGTVPHHDEICGRAADKWGAALRQATQPGGPAAAERIGGHA